MNNMERHLNTVDMFGQNDETKPKTKFVAYGRKSKPLPRMGQTCPTCREKRSLTGNCYCNF